MPIFELHFSGFTIAPTYYGLMYALSFLLCYVVLVWRKTLKKELLDDLFLYVFVGVVLGGRLGYVLFYNFAHAIDNPASIFAFWEGGMSFHGGVIGVICALILFSKIKKVDLLRTADHVCLVLPIGLFFGRIGNYINKELLGYSGYNGPFAVVKNGVSYFPSPLLEALLEGIVLYIILYVFYRSKHRKKGQIAALFLVFYAIFRILVEIFFRTPDAHIGYIFSGISLGSLLSFPMLLIGGILYFIFSKKDA